MIQTGSYKNCKGNCLTVSISGDKGKSVNYEGEYFPLLAPKLSFWKIWHSNIGIIPEEENTMYYIEEYYKQVLSKLDPMDIYNKLEYKILLCYEDNMAFCHRHIVAFWLQILLDIEVPEVKVNGCKIEKLERPSYIREYLEEVMKKNKNMRGFNSLRALYLFEKGEEYEAKANELEEKTGKCYDSYRQAACYYRCDADEEEYKYNAKQKIKKMVLDNLVGSKN